MKREVVVEGRGLHTGEAARVKLHARKGAVALRVGATEAPLRELRVVDAHRGTTVQLGDASVRTVEHLFAACAGLGLYADLLVAVEGPELPLLDGGASEWMRALESLELEPSPPSLCVAKGGDVLGGAGLYRFSVQDELAVSVSIDFDDLRVTPEAAWDGTHATFRTNIAPARTFAFARDLEELARAGLASHATPTSAVLIAPDRIHCAGAPFSPDEPARHKLLDLIGDLYLYGGPPIGSVRAELPGHAATHAAVREALAGGILTRT